MAGDRVSIHHTQATGGARDAGPEGAHHEADSGDREEDLERARSPIRRPGVAGARDSRAFGSRGEPQDMLLHYVELL